MLYARLPHYSSQPGMRPKTEQHHYGIVPELLPRRPLLLLPLGFCPCEIDLARHPPAFRSCLFSAFEGGQAQTFGERLFHLLLTGERRRVEREGLKILFEAVGYIVTKFSR